MIIINVTKLSKSNCFLFNIHYIRQNEESDREWNSMQ